MKIRGGIGLLLLSVPAMALTVCADPDYLPYSNRAGEGFENKIAGAVAKALGEPLEYTWASHRAHGGFTQFLSSTLDAKKCDTAAVAATCSFGGIVGDAKIDRSRRRAARF